MFRKDVMYDKPITRLEFRTDSFIGYAFYIVKYFS